MYTGLNVIPVRAPYYYPSMSQVDRKARNRHGCGLFCLLKKSIRAYILYNKNLQRQLFPTLR